MRDRAFAEFAAGATRPRHITVPIRLLEAVAPPPPAPSVTPHIQADAPNIAAIADMVAQARRPMFLFGGGARHAVDVARRVVARTQAATFTTYAGRGIIAPDTPNFLGSALARPGSADIIGDSDLVIAVGTEQGGPIRLDEGQLALEDGEVLVARLDLDGLERLADAGDGDFSLVAHPSGAGDCV